MISYRTHSEEELNAFRDQYNLRSCNTACGGCGFCKCDLRLDGAVSSRVLATVSRRNGRREKRVTVTATGVPHGCACPFRHERAAAREHAADL